MTTMETPDNIEQIRALEKLAEDWLDKNPPEDFDATTLQRLMIGFHQSIAPQTYRMSKDYEALWDIVCQMKYALGRVPCEVRGYVAVYIDIANGWVSNCKTMKEFLAECQRLNLEWLTPSKTLTDEEINLIVDLNRTKIEHMDLDSTQAEDEERIYQNGRIDGIKEGLEIARDNDYLAPQEKAALLPFSENLSKMRELYTHLVLDNRGYVREPGDQQQPLMDISDENECLVSALIEYWNSKAIIPTEDVQKNLTKAAAK